MFVLGMAAWALRPVRPVKALTEPEEPTRETLLLSGYDIEKLERGEAV